MRLRIGAASRTLAHMSAAEIEQLKAEIRQLRTMVWLLLGMTGDRFAASPEDSAAFAQNCINSAATTMGRPEPASQDETGQVVMEALRFFWTGDPHRDPAEKVGPERHQV